jgi:hypothetical protein
MPWLLTPLALIVFFVPTDVGPTTSALAGIGALGASLAILAWRSGRHDLR